MLGVGFGPSARRIRREGASDKAIGDALRGSRCEIEEFENGENVHVRVALVHLDTCSLRDVGFWSGIKEQFQCDIAWFKVRKWFIIQHARLEGSTFLEREAINCVYIVVGTTVGITLLVLLVLLVIYACWRTRIHANPQEADGPAPAVVGRRLGTARRLDQRAIELFPMLSFPGDGTVGFGESGCQICCDEFVHGEGVRVLPTCNHIFHNDCITKWLTSSSTECPICRHDYLGV